MLGYGFMGRAYSYAMHRVNALASGPPVALQLSAVCGRSRDALDCARRTYGWERGLEDWRDLLADGDLDLFVNAGPNNVHAAPVIAALSVGTHVICEKPLARSASEASGMAQAAQSSTALAMCGFNYRYFPAIDLARTHIERGELGNLCHFRSRFLLSTGLQADRSGWRLRASAAGSGALGDLASHHVDLACLLVGEPHEVSGQVTGSRLGGSDVDESVRASLIVADAVSAVVEASTVAGGHACTSVIEVDGTEGSVRFDVARLNELEIRRHGDRQILHVTGNQHPFMSSWFPPGHGIGWADSLVHQLADACWAILEGRRSPMRGASLHDGYRCAEVCDAIERSAKSRRVEPIAYAL